MQGLIKGGVILPKRKKSLDKQEVGSIRGCQDKRERRGRRKSVKILQEYDVDKIEKSMEEIL